MHLHLDAVVDRIRRLEREDTGLSFSMALLDAAYDIHIFQDLPLHVRKDVTSHGVVLYHKDYVETFNVFLRTIREYEDFKPRLDLCHEGLRR